ncbi:hypothetical protein [Bacillus sp. FJAT-26390]|uniref:hypothetical protein n=1 Tax=Bacillus sp. FJAT-26390 TaxID=1743142 RepID=UPI000807E5A2|nr:hypothetical protein [Bacillus sp. FJAT-26390]OBZ13934.1 hypothetical protein A7975_10800 [Bacillus sp. FJAT-26390]
MNFEKALAEELSSLAGIGGRVFPIMAPDTIEDPDGGGDDVPLVTPYILYESGYGVEEKALGGYLDMREIEGEINVVTSTYAGLKQNVAAIIERLKSFERRAIGSDALFISEVTYEAPVELWEPLPKLYRSVIEFKVNI